MIPLHSRYIWVDPATFLVIFKKVEIFLDFLWWVTYNCGMETILRALISGLVLGLYFWLLVGIYSLSLDFHSYSDTQRFIICASIFFGSFMSGLYDGLIRGFNKEK